MIQLSPRIEAFSTARPLVRPELLVFAGYRDHAPETVSRCLQEKGWMVHNTVDEMRLVSLTIIMNWHESLYEFHEPLHAIVARCY